MKKFFPLMLLALSIQVAHAAQQSSLDCTDEEVANYVDQSKFQKGRGYNTAPNTGEFINAEMEKARITEGEDAAEECNTIFSEGIDTSSASSVFDKIQGIFDDPVGAATEAGKAAQERVTSIYEEMSSELEKGVCERLSSKNVNKTVGDQIETVYKSQTGDSVLSGTRIDTSDIGIGGAITTDPSDVVGKNFTYNIIKNMLGKNSSSIAKLLDFTNPNQANAVIDYGTDIANDQIDALEESIFGK